MTTTRIHPFRERNITLKAHRLLAEQRCHPVTVDPGRTWVGVIEGDHDRYLVTAVSHDAVRQLNLGTGSVPARQSCTCPAGRHGDPCAHGIAAWLLLLESIPSRELFDALA